jgi:hypothetical protein
MNPHRCTRCPEREAILRAVQFEAENQSLPYPTRSTMEMLGKKIRARGTP